MATREQTAEMIKVMQHYVDGGEVQVDTETLDGWRDAKDPSFTFLLKWRIKPKPAERWAMEFRSTNGEPFFHSTVYSSEKKANDAGRFYWPEKFIRAVRFVQVEDET